MLNIQVPQNELDELMSSPNVKSPTTVNSSAEIKERITFEEALDKCGGFGRFQWIITILFCTCFTTGGQIINGIGFLYVLPNQGRGYLCKDEFTHKWSQCDRDYICSNHLPEGTWQIDYSSPNSFKNWVDPENIDLTCVSSGIPGLIGTFYFIGFMISSLTVPRLSDRYYGRKRPYVISLTLQTIFHIIILFSHNIWLNIILFFLVGCCAGGRVCVGLSYLNEFVPERYQNITSVMFTNMDALVMTYQGLFYLYVPDWYYVHGVAILAAIVLLACAFQFPESPKYMYANHRYGETRTILKIIAGKNGAAVTNDEIDNFLFEFEGIEYMSLLVQVLDPKGSKVESVVSDVGQKVIRLEGKVSEIFSIIEIRTNFFCLLTILTSSCFCFFLINFQMKAIPGDLISMTVVSSLSEFIAGCIAGSLYLRLGPKYGQIFAFALSASGTLILFFFWTTHSPRVVLISIIVAKFGMTLALDMIFVAFIYLIPTILCSTVFGFCNAAARTVNALSSLAAELNYQAMTAINLIFCLAAIVAAASFKTKLPKFI